jgi:Adenylate and Guanylate cyclase catalytic domain/3'5'-cyclic nucleotide phosphodiesterase
MIAKRRHVFKVETVGDCYVAAAGLPDPCEDHAVVMARFARLCMEQMRRIVRALERSLGPDTAELAMRAGMHSGPVTAGVLRGERSRFQLFGDTMNTAARMEQSGVKNRIQVTEDTHKQLCAHGKSRWLVLREDKVSPKGKGEMITYWLKPSRQFGDSVIALSSQNSCSGSVGTASQGATSASGVEASNVKVTRLIDWNVQVLEELLKRIVARREVCQENDKTPPNEELFKHSMLSAIDEVREIINLPRFDERALQSQRDPERIQLPQAAIRQLYQFVQNIAAMYRDNPFHNFEHASHVLMSVYKLLNRIIAPDITCGLIRTELDGIETISNDNKNSSRTFRRSFGQDDVNAAVLHDHTYGITSDPLTQFACVLSALIHDCDHPGVPNTQLVKENAVVAIHYKQQSIAEQNSIDLAWALLMSDDYVDLRNVIYQTDAELRRFRELVVNSVMATDIADKDLKALRNRRWDVAFNLLEQKRTSSKIEAINRKATIVIEHLIQASDVSHTMQHWHVYRKWNERFFMECYEAYVNDRAEKDPTEYWYKGEIGFFDFYIIPLAKKLKDCGVFGVSSDECLNYAVKNRQEWEARGVEIVNELVEAAKRKHSEFCSYDSFDM